MIHPSNHHQQQQQQPRHYTAPATTSAINSICGQPLHASMRPSNCHNHYANLYYPYPPPLLHGNSTKGIYHPTFWKGVCNLYNNMPYQERKTKRRSSKKNETKASRRVRLSLDNAEEEKSRSDLDNAEEENKADSLINSPQTRFADSNDVDGRRKRKEGRGKHQIGGDMMIPKMSEQLAKEV